MAVEVAGAIVAVVLVVCLWLWCWWCVCGCVVAGVDVALVLLVWLWLWCCWCGCGCIVADVIVALVLVVWKEGKRHRGAPRKRYKDQMKRQLAQAGISHPSWQQVASDRDSLRSSVRKASCKIEAERHEAAKEKCRGQKERAASLPSSSQTFVCPKCSRVCASRNGLSTATNDVCSI